MTIPDTAWIVSGSVAPPNPVPTPMPIDLQQAIAAAAGYAQIALEAGGAPTWTSITGKPTTLLGYGITDAAPLSHVGTRDGHPLATTSLDGLMPATSAAKLATVASGATANSPDATLLSRANHTGTQAAGTITGLATVATSGAYADLSGKPTVPTTTDGLTEGSTNLYFLASRVLAAVLTGLSTATNSAALATDTVLVAIGKLQAQIDAALTSISGKAAKGANSDITSLSGLTTPLSVAQGGTAGATAGAARTSLGAAASGANSDITSIAGLTTALSVGQGGTGATTAGAARTSLGAAASGANSDVTSLSGLTTPLSIGQGGTGGATAAAARTALGLGTAATLDVGTTANKVVQLDASGRLPAVDGSALTGISGGSGAVIYSGAQTLSAGEKTQARSNVGAAASGANTDITSLASLTSATASGLVTAGSLKVATGATVLRLVSAYANLDFPSIAAGSNEDLTITVTGALVGDSVALGLGSSPNAGLIFQAFVSATNTVTVRAHNKTAGAINIGSQSFCATVFGF